MSLSDKCKLIVDVVKTHGQQLREPEYFGYWGVEVIHALDRWYILLPFILNVSVGEDVQFHVGDEHVLNCLFDKLSPIADK